MFQFFIDPYKLLPLERFLATPKGRGGARGGRGGGRGGRGGKSHHKISLNPLYGKTCVKRSLSKRTKIGFQYQLSLNAGQKYCRI